MKPILIISFLILFKLSYGQLVLNNPNYYVYNGSKDTIYLTKLSSQSEPSSFRPRPTTKIVDTIQIDGLGAKEVVFERHYEGEISDIKQAEQNEET